MPCGNDEVVLNHAVMLNCVWSVTLRNLKGVATWLPVESDSKSAPVPRKRSADPLIPEVHTAFFTVPVKPFPLASAATLPEPSSNGQYARSSDPITGGRTKKMATAHTNPPGKSMITFRAARL